MRAPLGKQMTAEPDAGAGLGHDGCERGLVDLKRVAPQVVAVQLNEALFSVAHRTSARRTAAHRHHSGSGGCALAR